MTDTIMADCGSFRTLMVIFSWNESINSSPIGPWLHDYWLNHPPLPGEGCFLNPNFMLSGMHEDYVAFRNKMTLGNYYQISETLWRAYWEAYPYDSKAEF